MSDMAGAAGAAGGAVGGLGAAGAAAVPAAAVRAHGAAALPAMRGVVDLVAAAMDGDGLGWGGVGGGGSGLRAPEAASEADRLAAVLHASALPTWVERLGEGGGCGRGRPAGGRGGAPPAAAPLTGRRGGGGGGPADCRGEPRRGRGREPRWGGAAAPLRRGR